jgi:hypothetical protein
MWGGEKHQQMLNAIRPEECIRCTFTTYNEVIEQACIEDAMFRNFP